MTSAAENVEKLKSALLEVLMWVDRDSDSSVTQVQWDWHLRHYSKRASKLLKEIEDEEEREHEMKHYTERCFILGWGWFNFVIGFGVGGSIAILFPLALRTVS